MEWFWRGAIQSNLALNLQNRRRNEGQQPTQELVALIHRDNPDDQLRTGFLPVPSHRYALLEETFLNVCSQFSRDLRGIERYRQRRSVVRTPCADCSFHFFAHRPYSFLLVICCSSSR